MLKFRANKKRDREESEQGERTLIMWMCWVLLMVVESQKRVFKWASTLLSHTKSDQQWHKQQHRYTNLWFLFSFFGEWMFVRNNISNTHLKHKESRKKNFDHLLDSQVSEFDDFFCPSWNHVKHHRCHYYHHCVCLEAANSKHTHKSVHAPARMFAHIEWLLAKLTVCIIRLKSLYKCILKYCRMPPNISIFILADVYYTHTH